MTSRDSSRHTAGVRPRHQDDRQLSPSAIERAMRKARSEVKNLPAGFR